MRLADFIIEYMETILEEWESYARSIMGDLHMDQDALRDHAKIMLVSIAEDLASLQTSAEQISKSKGQADISIGSVLSNNLTDSAKEHSLSRIVVGFGVEKIVSEYRALRASVFRLWGEIPTKGQETDLRDMIRFNEAMDQVLAESVTTYVTEKNVQLRLLNAMLSSSPDHNFVMDLEGKFLYANKSLAQVLKRPVHEIIGKNYFDIGASKATAAALQEQIEEVIHTGQPVLGEVSQDPFFGEQYYYEYLLAPIFDQYGRVEAVTGTGRDNTERKALDDEILHIANHDHLTGLPSRRLFRTQFEHEIRHAERTKTQLALFFIDLDRFKEANDMLGHDAGDMLLQQVAERIRSCVGVEDTVARLGGDEFTIILTNFVQIDDAEKVARKILNELATPFLISQVKLQISASIGITLFPQDAVTSATLMRNADQAMYVAKKSGRNQFVFFMHNMHETAHIHSRLSADLRTALSGQQLVVYYQPIIDLFTGRICKAEALLRWLHPQLGVVLPGNFIGIAEESGLIHEIGHWVFIEAAKQAKACMELLGEPFQISINKSPIQFMAHPSGANWVEQLKHLGLACDSISIEITEGVLLNATTISVSKLKSLQEAGFELAIDDFGTGYSSMSYLNKFDVDYLKIDQSFVQNLETDVSSRTIAETIIVMAHKLGLKVIAEGVETNEQLDWLKAAGSDYAQGFLFSEAIPAQQFTQLLEAGI